MKSIWITALAPLVVPSWAVLYPSKENTKEICYRVAWKLAWNQAIAKQRGFMKTLNSLIAVTGLALAPFALAQSPAVASAPAAKAPAAEAAVVPPEQQATREQLTKLFQVMRLREQFDSMTKMMPAIVQQQVHEQLSEMAAAIPGGKQLSPQQQAALDKLMAKYMQKATTLYPADEMMNDAMAVYQHHMSRTDVDAFIAFYSSTPGQHLLNAQPVIMKEYMPVVTGKVQARTKELYAEMAEDMQNFLKAQPPQSAQPPAAGAGTPGPGK